jgi:hypothetical protein
MEISPTDVHTHEHLDPVLAFRATGAGVDLENGAQLIFFPAEHIQKLKIFDDPDGFFSMPVDFLFGSLSGLVKLIDDRQVFK